MYELILRCKGITFLRDMQVKVKIFGKSSNFGVKKLDI